MPSPPSPSRPPKVFEPVFLQFDILGESVGAKGAENFFCPAEGVWFFTPCVYTQNTPNFAEDAKISSFARIFSFPSAGKGGGQTDQTCCFLHYNLMIPVLLF